MSQSNIGPLRPGYSSAQASPADGADSSALTGKGLDFPTGTADHLFGEKKLVQVLAADSKKAATDHSWTDRLFKDGDGLAEKAAHAAQLFDNIQFHRGGQKDGRSGDVSAYNALVLLANILRSAKPEVIALIDAGIEPSPMARGNHTFTLTIGETSFAYSVRASDKEESGVGHLAQLKGLVSAHQAVKSRLGFLAAMGPEASSAQKLADLRLESYAAAVNERHRQSLGEITKAVLHSYAPSGKLTASLHDIRQKLETLTPWLEDARQKGVAPTEFTTLVETLPRGMGEDRLFAVAVANLLVGKGLLVPTYRGPGSLDEDGYEIPPPPPLPASTDISRAPMQRRDSEAVAEALNLGRIDEETDDDLKREISLSRHAQRGSSVVAESVPELPPPPDSDDEDDIPPPPPLEADYIIDDEAPPPPPESDDEGPPPPSESAATEAVTDSALFDAFFGFTPDAATTNDSGASSSLAQKGFRPPAQLTELDDEPPPPPPPLPDSDEDRDMPTTHLNLPPPER